MQGKIIRRWKWRPIDRRSPSRLDPFPSLCKYAVISCQTACLSGKLVSAWNDRILGHDIFILKNQQSTSRVLLLEIGSHATQYLIFANLIQSRDLWRTIFSPIFRFGVLNMTSISLSTHEKTLKLIVINYLLSTDKTRQLNVGYVNQCKTFRARLWEKCIVLLKSNSRQHCNH